MWGELLTEHFSGLPESPWKDWTPAQWEIELESICELEEFFAPSQTGESSQVTLALRDPWLGVVVENLD